MPRQTITATTRGDHLVLDSAGQAWTGDVLVGDIAYAAALAKAITRVNDDFADVEKMPAPSKAAAEEESPKKTAPSSAASSSAKK